MKIKEIIRNHKLYQVLEPPMMSEGVRRHGRSKMFVTCPFCRGTLNVYIWSFYGSGKICDCGAKLGVWVSLKEVGT